MPAPLPREFREDAIRVAKSRGPGVTIAQIAKDLRIHPSTLENWLRTDRVDAGIQPGTTTTEAAECWVRGALGARISISKPQIPSRVDRHRVIGSMGRVGSCGDNAAVESFFSLLQKNVLNRHSWATREELRVAIVTWTERTIIGDASNSAWAVRHRSSSRP